MAEKTFKKGDKVTWNSHGQDVEGEVVRKLTGETEIKGHKVATNAEPQYLVKSDKTGAEAAHKPDALTPRR